jgi:glycosyltransferase involved in cell wall biosynthesis
VTAADVSVVIPTRNRPHFLARAVDAALRQEGVRVEVIVVDDASDTPLDSRGAWEGDGITVLRHERNLGMGAARNTGWRAARGAWIAFLDDDDLWAPSKLASLLDAAGARDAGFAYSSAIVVDAALRPIGHEPAPDPDGLLPALIERCVMPGGTSNAIVRRDLLDEVDGFDEGFALSGDWDLWIRLAQRARAASSEEILVAYLHHAGSWSVIDEPGLDRDFTELVRKHGALARQLDVQMDVRDYELYIANRLFRSGRRRRAARRYLSVGVDHHDASSLVRAVGALAWPTRVSVPGRADALPAAPAWLSDYTPIRPA